MSGPGMGPCPSREGLGCSRQLLPQGAWCPATQQQEHAGDIPRALYISGSLLRLCRGVGTPHTCIPASPQHPDPGAKKPAPIAPRRCLSPELNPPALQGQRTLFLLGLSGPKPKWKQKESHSHFLQSPNWRSIPAWLPQAAPQGGPWRVGTVLEPKALQSLAHQDPGGTASAVARQPSLPSLTLPLPVLALPPQRGFPSPPGSQEESLCGMLLVL